jgi:hypothetical protein
MLIDKIPNIQLVQMDVNQAQAQANALVEGLARQTTVPETEEKGRVRPRDEGGKEGEGKARKREKGLGGEKKGEAGVEGRGEGARGGLVDIVI